MKLANWICGALFASALGESVDDYALLQARNVRVHQSALQLPAGDRHCVAEGDPHIKTFDGDVKNVMCYGPMGDYYLMQTSDVFVQARYMGYTRTDGYAWIRGLVIGGSAFGPGPNGGTIVFPVLNGGNITYQGERLARQFGTNTFPFSDGSGSLVIRKSTGPSVVAWDFSTDAKKAASLADQSNLLTYYIELRDANSELKWLAIINQGATQQHILISGTSDVLTGTTGQCGNNDNDPENDKFNLDVCPFKIDCSTPTLFDSPNDECDEPRDKSPCVDDKDKVEFYRNICDLNWNRVVHGDPTELDIGNCVYDCCGDRDSCPDLDNQGEFGDCLVQGDPHIKTFDSSTINQHIYGPLDDYVIMKNQFLTVHGRYESDRADKKAQIVGVAVSGPLVGGDTILFEKGYEHPPMIIANDGTTRSMTTTQELDDVNPLYTISYEPEGENLRFVLDSSKSATAKTNPLYTLNIKDAVGHVLATIRVNKPRHHTQTAAALHIRVLAGLLIDVDGQCGNYNGNPDDDANGIADIIDPLNNLFQDQNPDYGTPVPVTDCKPKQVDDATACCQAQDPGGEVSSIHACALDNCCGDDTSCDALTECQSVDADP